MMFAEPGSLGLKFIPNANGDVEVLAINPGTQACGHAELRPGLVLTAVDEIDVTALSYSRVIDTIRESER